MKPKYLLFTLMVAALTGVVYYGISPLFKHVRLDESNPSLVQSRETVSIPNDLQTEKNEKTAEIVGTAGHEASGVVRIVENNRKTYLRYENFKTINGPDLFVYLSKDKDAKDFINLGPLKATEGNINYEIPANVNVREYQYALVWCRAFKVLFNSADLRAVQ